MALPRLHRHCARRPRLLLPLLSSTRWNVIERSHGRRTIVVLGIETSCDDTSVALLERRSDPPTTRLLFHRTVTSDNLPTRGIHPLTSLSSHRTHLAPLIAKALAHLPRAQPHPDLVAATRGPGMRASLAAGLDVAKGLAVAWGVPLVGVNHMLGHALTVRMVSALKNDAGGAEPRFPFWSLLVSGGHTIVVRSEGVMRHRVWCETVDLAVGDMLDKAARCVVPEEVIAAGAGGKGGKGGVVYGRVLEEFAFPGGGGDDEGSDYNYHPPNTPARLHQEAELRYKYPAWSPLPAPFASTAGKHHLLAFSFSGIGSSVERALRRDPGMEMPAGERRWLARQAMQCAFEHLAKRVVLALRAFEKTLPVELVERGVAIAAGQGREEVLVLSGGVAANKFLRRVLRGYFANEGVRVRIVVPPGGFCTDNAAMIAWAGLEIWEGGVGVGVGGEEGSEGGWATGLGCHPVRKWSLDSEGDGEEAKFELGEAEARGMLGVDCWVRRGEWEGERRDEEGVSGGVGE